MSRACVLFCSRVFVLKTLVRHVNLSALQRHSSFLMTLFLHFKKRRHLYSSLLSQISFDDSSSWLEPLMGLIFILIHLLHWNNLSSIFIQSTELVEQATGHLFQEMTTDSQRGDRESSPAKPPAICVPVWVVMLLLAPLLLCLITYVMERSPQAEPLCHSVSG